MPPHCDSLSGPVVKMAKKALETGNVKLILPYVPEESEDEVIAAFHKVLPLHKQPNGARDIADMFFFLFRPSIILSMSMYTGVLFIVCRKLIHFSSPSADRQAVCRNFSRSERKEATNAASLNPSHSLREINFSSF